MDYWTLLLGLAGTVLLQTASGQDPCTGRIETLTKSADRTISTEPDYDSGTICDYLTIPQGRWFRLSTDDSARMPERCVDNWSCGTQNPIWLNGKHPQHDSIVQLQVCMNEEYPSDGGCCDWNTSIPIKRCQYTSGGYFYIYQLADPPKCDSAYCIEDSSQPLTPAPTPSTPETPAPTPATTALPPATPAPTTETPATPAITAPPPATPVPTTETPANPTPTTEIPATPEPPPPSTCPQHKIQDPDNANECLDRFPIFSGLPTLEGPELVDRATMAFYCNIHYTRRDTLSRERFYVTFLFDGVSDGSAPSRTDRDGLRIKLNQARLEGKAGKKVSCSVTSSWEFSSHVTSPVQRSSNDYILAIRPRYGKTSFDLREGDEGTLTLQPQMTAPVTCPHKTRYCRLKLRLTEQSPGITYGGACAYFMRQRDWRPDEKLGYNVNITVKARSNPVNRGNQQYLLQFDEVQHSPSQVWNGYRMPPIQIHIKDSPYGLCKAELDTAITTFDHKEYTLRAKGEFVLMRSSTARKYEVQIRTSDTSSRCNFEYGVACICGVAVRERNVVMVIDMCNTSPGEPQRPVIYSYGDTLPPGYDVTRNGPGTRFSINLASGAHVIVDVQSHGMHVYTFAIGEDYSLTSSLCGVYDGNQDNDVHPVSPTDIAAVRVPRGMSFFDREPEPIKEATSDLHFCTCNKGTILCEASEGTDAANYYGAPGKGGNGGLPGRTLPQPPNKNKRGPDPSNSLDRDDDVSERYDFDYGENDVFPTPPDVAQTWPTPKGRTEAETRRTCTETLKGTAYYSLCSNKVKATVDGIIEKCVNAVQRADDDAIIPAVLSGYEHQCVFKASTDPTLQDSEPGGGSRPPNDVIQDMCPGNCSSRGHCQNKVCHCDAGYVGSDCSVSVSDVPRLYRLTNGPTCDVRARLCRLVHVLADNIADTTSLTCRVTLIDYSGVEIQTHTTSGFIRSFSEVSCNLPSSPILDPRADELDFPWHRWRVEVSNDGIGFSGSLDLVVWDSKCLNCSMDGTCNTKPKPQTCLIRGRCYSLHEESPLEPCAWCEPATSTTAFTRITGNRPPEIQSPFHIVKLAQEHLTHQVDVVDPDGQTRFEYAISQQSDNAEGLTLRTDGSIRISTSSGNSSFAVEARDSCGAKDEERFTVTEYACPCQNEMPCDDRSSTKPTKYNCECDAIVIDDATCSANLQNCLAPVCPGRVVCKLNPYSDNYTCECTASQESTKRCSSARDSQQCTTWSAWGTCSKPCDFGVSSRTRNCGYAQDDVETSLCNRKACQESADERNQGVIVVTSVREEYTIDEILKKLDIFVEAVRLNINRECVERSEDCCSNNIVLIPSLLFNFVPSNYIANAKSYPRPNYEDKEITFKFLSKMSPKSLKKICGWTSNTRHKRDVIPSDGHEVPDGIIEAAVQKSVEQFERHGLVIRSVKPPQPPGLPTYVVPVGATGGVILLVIIVIVVVTTCVIKKRREAARRAAAAKEKDMDLTLPPDVIRRPSRDRRSLFPDDMYDDITDYKYGSRDSFGTTWDTFSEHYEEAKGERDSGMYDVPTDTTNNTYDNIPGESDVTDHVVSSGNYQSLQDNTQTGRDDYSGLVLH